METGHLSGDEILAQVKPWGGRTVADATRAKDPTCPHCQRFELRPHQFRRWAQQVVAYDKTAKAADEIGTLKCGAVIIECPECFGLFWHHVHDRTGLRLYIQCCPNWPALDE